MEIYRFGEECGREISQFGSAFVMSRIIQTDKAAHIGCMYLKANGIIGYHQAVSPQLLLITAGEGEVKGEKDEYVKVQAGDAVFWQKEEWHETITAKGLTALIIESEELTPALFMAPR